MYKKQAESMKEDGRCLLNTFCVLLEVILVVGEGEGHCSRRKDRSVWPTEARAARRVRVGREPPRRRRGAPRAARFSRAASAKL